jgi:hypothetical protein
MTDDERDEKIIRIEQFLSSLVRKQKLRDWYTIEELAETVGKAVFTVREWARKHRINAEKRGSGRGPFAEWVVSHQELLRYQREGLLVVGFPSRPRPVHAR